MLLLKRSTPLLVGILLLLILNPLLRPAAAWLVFAPILVVLVAMLFFKLGGHIAGPIGLITTIFLAVQSFGLTPQILFYSQWKGLNLSLFVLLVFFPALLLYQTVNKAGGIAEITHALRSLITDRPLLLLVIAIAFSAMLEGVAGFGLPVAIISPILVNLGVPPIQAIASVAIGHAWSVSYGDMGAIFQTLRQLVQTPVELFNPPMAFLLGVSVLLCALAVAHLQKSLNRWLGILVISGVMIAIQSFCVLNGLVAISNLLAGAAGILAGVVISRFYDGEKELTLPKVNRSLRSALVSYGLLSALLFAVTSVPLVYQWAQSVIWQVSFPELVSGTGFRTPAVTNSYFPLYHTGTTTLLVVAFTYWMNQHLRLYSQGNFAGIFSDTIKTSWQAIVGILSMVGLAAIMDHTGMTVQMARSISGWFGEYYPFVSPLIGTLGAFATGSNSNSNVLFASMQENVAALLGLAPALMIAAQTTGGSLGSMVAPAKISVGCTTTGMAGKEGEVLRVTLPYGLAIGAIVGAITFAMAVLG